MFWFRWSYLLFIICLIKCSTAIAPLHGYLEEVDLAMVAHVMGFVRAPFAASSSTFALSVVYFGLRPSWCPQWNTTSMCCPLRGAVGTGVECLVLRLHFDMSSIRHKKALSIVPHLCAHEERSVCHA